MKKIIVAGVTLLTAWMIAAPGFAIETKVTGTFTLDGVMTQNSNLADDSDAEETVAYREMQLRVNTESVITDKIKVYSRFDILDKVLNSASDNVGDGTGLAYDARNTGSNNVGTANDEDNNIQIDRLWMEIVTSVGLFRVGRKEYTKWGTSFWDDGLEAGSDRLEWVVPMDLASGKFYIVTVAEKALETQTSNRDNDKFYLTGTYATKDYRTGLLFGYYAYNTFLAESSTDGLPLIAAANAAYTATPNLATLQALGAALGAYYVPRIDSDFMYIAPYFSGKVGGVDIKAEFGYITGEINYMDPAQVARDAADDIATATGSDPYAKADIDAMVYWLELGYDVGPANVQAGYAFMSGDDTPTTGDLEAAAFLAPGRDWGKVFILTGDDHGMEGSLGGDGNVLKNGSAMNAAGYALMYLACDYKLNDSLSFGGLVAQGKADAPVAGTDDDYGIEVDLSLSWKCMQNLEYNAKVGYLMAGDFWKAGGATDVGDVTAMYHELVLSF